MKKFIVYTNINLRVEAENEAEALRKGLAQLGDLPVTNLGVNQDYDEQYAGKMAQLEQFCATRPG